MGLASMFGAGAVGGAVVGVTIKAIDSYSKELEKASGSFGKFGTSVAKFAAGAVASLAAFTAYAVSEYIEVEKINQRISYSFGNLAKSVERDSKTMADRSVRSIEEFKNAFVSTKPLIDSFGLSYQQQTQLILRASEIASASGKGFDEVLNTLTNTLSGKVGTAARSLGISIDTDITKSMTDAQQAVYILNEVLGDTAKAMGADIAETQTLGGQLQVLNKILDDFVQTFGEGFVKGISDADGTLKGLNKTLQEFSPTIYTLGLGLGQMVNGAIKGALWAMQAFSDAVDKTIVSVWGLKVFAELLWAGVPALRALDVAQTMMDNKLKQMKESTVSVKTSTDSLAGSVAGLGQAYDYAAQACMNIPGAVAPSASYAPAPPSGGASKPVNSDYINPKDLIDSWGKSGTFAVGSHGGVGVASVGGTIGTNAAGNIVATTAGGLMGYSSTRSLFSANSTKKKSDASLMITPGGNYEFAPDDNISVNASKGSGQGVGGVSLSNTFYISALDGSSISESLIDQISEKLAINVERYLKRAG